MKVSVQFPMLTKSENLLRSLPFVVANAPANKRMGIAMSIAGKVKKQRAEVRMMLDSQLPRLRRELVELRREQATTRPNFYRVTIIRISAGQLDTDGLHGALKEVRDEVAAWLGIDDSARSPASWRVGQQRCPKKMHGVRIEIEDDDPDAREVHRIVGGTIPLLGPVVGDVQHAPSGAEAQRWPAGLIGASAPSTAAILERQAVKRQQQASLPFRRAYYAPPGQDEDAEEVTLEELTGPIFEALMPPPRIMKGGRILHRRLDQHPALGEHWIYEPAPSAARVHHEERTEARR